MNEKVHSIGQVTIFPADPAKPKLTYKYEGDSVRFPKGAAIMLYQDYTDDDEDVSGCILVKFDPRCFDEDGWLVPAVSEILRDLIDHGKRGN